MHSKTRNHLRPTLDSLEARDVPTGWLSSAWPTIATPVAPAPSAPTAAVVSAPAPAPAPAPALIARAEYSPISGSALNTQVVSYLESHVGQRVGGGECAHLAVEALRASGAKFAWLRSGTTDYAWGQRLTTVVGTAGGGVYRAAAWFQPGDVIQFTRARFRDGTWAGHHTAVVAAVDGAGRVTAVYQQNFNGVRAVTRQPLDLSQLTGGYVKVYRPLARTPVAGAYRFTLVNNTGVSVGVIERAGTGWSAYRLSAANTLGSYQVRGWTTAGGVRPTITAGGHLIAVTDGAAYEVYSTGSGVAVRQIG